MRGYHGPRSGRRTFPRGAWERDSKDNTFPSFPRSAWECLFGRSAAKTSVLTTTLNVKQVRPSRCGSQEAAERPKNIPTRSMGTRFKYSGCFPTDANKPFSQPFPGGIILLEWAYGPRELCPEGRAQTRAQTDSRAQSTKAPFRKSFRGKHLQIRLLCARMNLCRNVGGGRGECY